MADEQRDTRDHRDDMPNREGGPALLEGRLVRPKVGLSPSTSALLEAACPAIVLSPALRRRLDGLGAQAERDLAFETSLGARERPSLGRYLVFLRQQTGLSVRETAAKLRLDFQFLADLERDGLAPGEIPAGRFAALLKRLQASLEMTERLITTTIRCPRYQVAPAEGRLFRAAPGASRSEAAASSRTARGEPVEWIQNPEYQEQLAAAGRLMEQLRDLL